MIKSKLSTSGINQIKEYYEKGGIIFVSGKSGYLFENFGLSAKNIYDFNKLVTLVNNDRLISIKGCEKTAMEFSKVYILKRN